MKPSIEKLKIVPVVAIDAIEMAAPLADALCKGGLPCAEITLRTEAGLGAIKALSGRDDFLLGAGTVHSMDQAKAVVDAGADFIVAPGMNPRTIIWCLENKIPIYPGIATPTDLEMALEFGLKVVKFFPAETLGGVKTLKAFSGPYGEIQFMPTGGINKSNMSDYLHLSSVIAVGGSWMVQPEFMRRNDYDSITHLTAEAVKLALPHE